MTIIEFYDENAIENVVSMLLCQPDKVILIGHEKQKKLEPTLARYRRLAAGRGINVAFEYKSVSRTNLSQIVSALTELVQKAEGWVTIDLSGGDDLYLVAAGILFECFGEERVRLHRFNIRNGVMNDSDADGNLLRAEPALISAEENICAYGGRILYDDEDPLGAHRWDYSWEFEEDIHTMWSICRRDPEQWNEQVTLLSGQTCPANWIKPDFLQKLQRSGLVKSVEDGRITYKNDQVRLALQKAGNVLELLIASAAAGLTDEEGNEIYNDVLCGALIDWDGELGDPKHEVRNEIDVLLMKGLVPIFISCKNGHAFQAEELYKLNTVAEEFGGIYARKVLIAPELDRMEIGKAEYIRARAKEMQIRIVETDELEGEALYDTVRTLDTPKN